MGKTIRDHRRNRAADRTVKVRKIRDPFAKGDGRSKLDHRARNVVLQEIRHDAESWR